MGETLHEESNMVGSVSMEVLQSQTLVLSFAGTALTMDNTNATTETILMVMGEMKTERSSTQDLQSGYDQVATGRLLIFATNGAVTVIDLKIHGFTIHEGISSDFKKSLVMTVIFEAVKDVMASVELKTDFTEAEVTPPTLMFEVKTEAIEGPFTITNAMTGNTDSGDGCDSTCHFEMGWE